MIVHEGYKNLTLNKPVVTMGIFDGVHLGHRHLLDSLSRVAEIEGGESVVITFNPHPRIVLSGKQGAGLYFLSTMDEKLRLLEKVGIDHLIVIPFDQEFSRITACDFVEDVLVRHIGTKYLVVGHDHHFGYMGKGNYDTITNCAGLLNFTVKKAEGISSGEGFISSSLIRQALMSGRLEDANKWLGYHYTLTGKVTEGKKLGRKLGFPTANLVPGEHKLIPADGVYAVGVTTGGNNYKGILSIGRNPTVNMLPAARSVEVNILDFDSDIYGADVTITFRFRLRDEKKFQGTEELVRQMNADRELAMRLLH